MSQSRQNLFTPFDFANGTTLRNRLVMAPMTTWSGNADGTVTEDEVAYYRRRANGVGLVITGCTHVQANGVGFTDEFAAYDDSFTPSLRRLAEAAKSGGAQAILQIFHAGNKALPNLTPNGDVVSASPIATPASAFAPSLTPRALSHDEILEVIRAFGQTTRRAIEAGFDGIELHGAHGFLIQNFFSPHFNQRQDQWGGSLENRMRFPLAVLAEVRRVAQTYSKGPFLIGYRISVEEPMEGGLRIEDSYALLDRLAAGGADYVHVSLANLLDNTPIGATEPGTIVELVVDRVGAHLPVLAAGQIRKPEQAVQAIALGLSLVAIGQGLVMNPDWVELAREHADNQIDTTLSTAKAARITLPGKLWAVIQASTGWFSLEASPARNDGVEIADSVA
jgi:2,4-dienoyl-CoA reductase-like NADH-dependent reductase (Old Yellow Enzyme family)